jgi:hypothetical protein
MNGWIYTMVFIVTLLITLKYTIRGVIEIMSSDPVIALTWKEQLIYAIAIAYTITFLIY